MRKSRFAKYLFRTLLVVVLVGVSMIVVAQKMSDKELNSDSKVYDAEAISNAQKVPITLYVDEGMLQRAGDWTSPTYDLVKLASVPIDSGTIPLMNFNFYYGDVTNVDNKDNDAYSIEQLSKFDVIVTQEPGENEESRQQLVLKSLIEKGVKVFGYVQVGPLPGEMPPTDEEIEAAIKRCADFGYYGVFFDMCGYDYEVTRAHLNSIINYTHSKKLVAFVNAWYPSDVLDSKVDEVYNPRGISSAMTNNDWVLLESFYLRSDDKYAGDPEGGFLYSFEKYKTSVSLANALGVNVCGLAYARPDTSSQDLSDWKKSYELAVGLGLKGLSYSRSVNNMTIEWPLALFDLPKIGTALISSFKQTAQDTYEAKTNAGIIGFIASDKPVMRNSYSFQVPSLFTVEVRIPSLVKKYKLLYFASTDGLVWNKLNDPITSERFFKVQIISESEPLKGILEFLQ